MRTPRTCSGGQRPLDFTFDTRGADLLYQVFNKRYQRSSTIVTTNLPFKDWGKLFTNSAAASRSLITSFTRGCSCDAALSGDRLHLLLAHLALSLELKMSCDPHRLV